MVKKYKIGTKIRFKETTENASFRGIFATVIGHDDTYAAYLVEFEDKEMDKYLYPWIQYDSKNIELAYCYQSPLWKVLNGEEI